MTQLERDSQTSHAMPLTHAHPISHPQESSEAFAGILQVADEVGPKKPKTGESNEPRPAVEPLLGVVRGVGGAEKPGEGPIAKQKPGVEEKMMSKQRSSEKKCSKVESVCNNIEEGPVLGDPPVWWRGPGWKSNQATKPSRGPGAVSLASSTSTSTSKNVAVSHENVAMSRRNVAMSRMTDVSVTLGEEKCVHMRVKCGLCDGSVKQKSCIGTATTRISSLYNSAEGGPQSKRGGGEAKIVAELSEGNKNLKGVGHFKSKLVPETSPPTLFSPVKKFSKSEAKNPYMGSRGTPTKRKLVENKTVKTLISLFDTRCESDLPGDELIGESPAKRRRRQLQS